MKPGETIELSKSSTSKDVGSWRMVAFQESEWGLQKDISKAKTAALYLLNSNGRRP